MLLRSQPLATCYAKSACSLYFFMVMSVFWGQKTWVQSSPASSHLVLDKLLKLSIPQFPHFLNGMVIKLS